MTDRLDAIREFVDTNPMHAGVMRELLDEIAALRERHAEEAEYWFAAGWTAARRTKPAEYQETEHTLQHDAYLSEARKVVARDDA